eukprot:TRINITY_DN7472_c0_g1_i1.p1 TRINITY_DN7472_c0_g1~~TRINITY_DN7472_c0_g1_i1.p1  ORF type:complete len:143 (+),score=29.69 TRINITY_DN7472_c0_g1_i1:54-482(+)
MAEPISFFRRRMHPVLVVSALISLVIPFLTLQSFLKSQQSDKHANIENNVSMHRVYEPKTLPFNSKENETRSDTITTHAPKSQYAYVTMLGSDNYLAGCQALVQSLLQSHTTHDIVVLHTQQISKRYLFHMHLLGVRVIQVS